MRIFDEGLIPHFDKTMLVEADRPRCDARWQEWLLSAATSCALVALLAIGIALRCWRFLPPGLWQ